jgi:hypothetical protein
MYALSRPPKDLWSAKLWFLAELAIIAALGCLAILAVGGWWG